MLGLGLGIKRSGIAPSYDSDAKSYFERAGITDPVAKRAWSDFIVGLKRIDIFQYLDEGYGFREGQNAGVDTTFYNAASDQRDGSLTNGPTWGVDGVSKTTNLHGTNIPGVSFDMPVSIFAVAKTRIANSTRMYGDAGIGNAFYYLHNNAQFYNQVGGIDMTGIPGFIDDVFFSAGMKTPDSGTAALYANGVLIHSAPADGVSQGTGNMDIMSTGFDGPMTIAGFFKFSADLTDAQFSDLHALYAKTLGAGLDLEFDPDARAYFQRVKEESGVTMPYSERQNVSDFFAGLKSGGAWDGFRQGYLFRSSQNAGTGTAVYGLRGNDSDGTLVNDPSWGVDGISTVAASGQYMSIPGGLPSVMPESSGDGWSIVTVLASGGFIQGFFVGANGGYELTQIYNSSGGLFGNWTDNAWVDFTYNTPLPVPAVVSLQRLGDDYEFYANGSQLQAGSSTASTTPLAAESVFLANGRLTPGSDFATGTVAAILVFNGTPPDQSDLYTLCKNTICKNLNLP